MVLSYDPQTHEAVICSAWGKDSRLDPEHPGPSGAAGPDRAGIVHAEQRFLSKDESLAVVAGFRRRHPYRLRLLDSVLGWGDLRSDAAAREFVSTRPFVSLRRRIGSGQQAVQMVRDMTDAGPRQRPERTGHADQAESRYKDRARTRAAPAQRRERRAAGGGEEPLAIPSRA